MAKEIQNRRLVWVFVCGLMGFVLLTNESDNVGNYIQTATAGGVFLTLALIIAGWPAIKRSVADWGWNFFRRARQQKGVRVRKYTIL